MPVGTPFHERTLPLVESLSYREWAGYFAPSSYEPLHEHEYNAIRNAAGLIDISPLFKYLISGRDAAALINRIITRDVDRLETGQVLYTPWCDEHGLVLDDGTVARLGEQRFRWTAAEPNYRWIRQNAAGLDVEIEDVSDRVAALAIQGPTSAAVLRSAAEADIDGLKYFRVDIRPDRRTVGGDSRARAIRVTWATKCGWRARMRLRSGTRLSAPAVHTACGRPDCSRSTSRASRRACSCSTSISSPRAGR